VLAGDQGQFCAGADLKKIAEGQPNRIEPDGDGPMGPTRMILGKPVISAIAGYAVAGGLELALWCDLRVMEEDAVLGGLLPALGSAADRWWNRALAAADRAEPYTGPDSNRQTGRIRRSLANGVGQPRSAPGQSQGDRLRACPPAGGLSPDMYARRSYVCHRTV
jgi:hypothetical protein